MIWILSKVVGFHFAERLQQNIPLVRTFHTTNVLRTFSGKTTISLLIIDPKPPLALPSVYMSSNVLHILLFSNSFLCH